METDTKDVTLPLAQGNAAGRHRGHRTIRRRIEGLTVGGAPIIVLIYQLSITLCFAHRERDDPVSA